MGDKRASTYYDVHHCALRLSGTLILYKGQVARVLDVNGGADGSLDSVSLYLSISPYTEGNCVEVPLLSEEVSLRPFELGFIDVPGIQGYIYSYRVPSRTANQGLRAQSIQMQGPTPPISLSRSYWLEAFNKAVKGEYLSPVAARRAAKKHPGTFQAISRDFAFCFTGLDDEGVSHYHVYFKWMLIGTYCKASFTILPRYEDTYIERLYKDALEKKS